MSPFSLIVGKIFVSLVFQQFWHYVAKMFLFYLSCLSLDKLLESLWGIFLKFGEIPGLNSSDNPSPSFVLSSDFETSILLMLKLLNISQMSSRYYLIFPFFFFSSFYALFWVFCSSLIWSIFSILYFSTKLLISDRVYIS